MSTSKDATLAQAITSDVLKWTFGVGALCLAAAVAVALARSPGANPGLANAAAAVALIGAAAVGIERVLEVFWSIVDSSAKSFWPFTRIDHAINDLVDAIDQRANGPVDMLETRLKQLKATDETAAAALSGVPGEIASIRDGVAQLRQYAPANDRAKLIADYTSKGLDAIAMRYPAAKADVGIALESINATSALVDSLASNPGRRILSIFFGMLLGEAVVLVLGLDLFRAILGTGESISILNQTLYVGVAVTGLVIGLGSNPTHELIKVLESVKENNQKAV